MSQRRLFRTATVAILLFECMVPEILLAQGGGPTTSYTNIELCDGAMVSNTVGKILNEIVGPAGLAVPLFFGLLALHAAVLRKWRRGAWLLGATLLALGFRWAVYFLFFPNYTPY